jgi:hypothetical protein
MMQNWPLTLALLRRGPLPLPARPERVGASHYREARFAWHRFTGITLLALLFALALPLTGCGKKGAPNPPPGVPDTYPRSYPRE